jgi:hypothetical protein
MICPIERNTLDEALAAMADTQAEAREQHAAKSAVFRRMLKDAKRGSHACPGGYFGACGRPISKNASRCWSCIQREATRITTTEAWMENAA